MANKCKTMSTQEYRDLADELMNRAKSLKACVGDAERAAWIPYTENLRLAAWAADCKRASVSDKERMERARKLLDDAYDSVVHLIPSPLGN